MVVDDNYIKYGCYSFYSCGFNFFRYYFEFLIFDFWFLVSGQGHNLATSQEHCIKRVPHK